MTHPDTGPPPEGGRRVRVEADVGELDRVVERVLDRVREYVELETPSGDVKRARAFAERIARDLEGAGAVAETRDAAEWGSHVLGRVRGRDPALEPVLVLGHFDTVWPAGTLRQRPFRISRETAEGPGIFDMKAALAVLVEVVAALAREGGARRPLEVLLTCDEEAGSGSSRALIEERAREAAAVLVLEPPLPGGAAKTSRKGSAGYTLRVAGRSAHAGLDPERGVSAVAELAHQVLAVLDLADPALGTTINVAPVGGGTVSNVVAAEAWAEIDVRFATAAEAERVDAALRSLQPRLEGARIHLVPHGRRPPLERTEGVAELHRHARRLAADLGFELEEGQAGGASDGSYTAALGVPTLDGLGVDGGGAHAEDEHIVIADLPRRIALLGRLIGEL